jgi:glycosyltransferase involved in cell wall biosynthesis
MRIVFVTPEFVTESNFDGGLANYLYRVSLSLIKFGHEPVIVVTSNRNEVINHHGIEVHRVYVNFDHWLLKSYKRIIRNKFNYAANWFFQSWLLNQTVKKIHKRKPVDIIQYASYTAIGYFRYKKVAAVVRLSSFQPLWRIAYGNLNPSNDELRMEELELLSFRKADGIFGPSVNIAKEVEQVIQKKVQVIESPFILETTTIDNVIYDNFLKGKKYLLFFGSLGLLKGVGIISEILYDLLKKYHDLYFVFAGKDFYMLDQIKTKAGEYYERVIYINKLPHSQLYPIISHANAVVLPSRVDNFPNTCLEAMAHRKVVIGTKDTSFEQLIIDGVSGFLCEKDNPADLLRTIEKTLVLSNHEMIRIGEKAYERILKLQPEIVVAELINYYHQIISCNGVK